MSEQVDDAPIDRGGYDVDAIQDKWRPVWEELTRSRRATTARPSGATR